MFFQSLFLLSSIFFVLCSCSATNTHHQHLLSPTLQKLKEELDTGDPKAIEKFWEKIEKEGSPLFEKIQGSHENSENTRKDDERYCTFLYSSEKNENIENVFLSVSYYFPWRNLQEWIMESLDLKNGQKIWYKTIKVRPDIRTEYRFAPNETLKSLEEIFFSEDYVKHSQHWKLDPLNKEIFTIHRDEEDSNSQDYIVSVLRGPNAPPQKHIKERPNIPKGKVFKFNFKSKILNKAKRLYIYTSPGYQKDKGPYDFLFIFDGYTYSHTIPTPTVLDNLLAEGQIRPLVAAFIDDEAGENSRLIELVPNETYPQFLREELLPWLRERYSITKNPAHSFIAGSSLGGLAATWNAFRNPDLFGNVISQSGAYFWHPEFNEEELKDPTEEELAKKQKKLGWLIREFQRNKQLPLRFYMDVGLLENIDPFGEDTSNLSFVRKMRDVLQAKGYPLTYVEYNGGHEYLWWQQTLADGLIALNNVKNYRKKLSK